MYRRALLLAARLIVYLFLVAAGLVLAARGAWLPAFAVVTAGVGVWMGGGSIRHLRHLLCLVAARPWRAAATLAMLVLLAVMWPPVLGICAVIGIVFVLDALQDTARAVVRGAFRPPHLKALGLFFLAAPSLATPNGVVPLLDSPVPIFSPA